MERRGEERRKLRKHENIPRLEEREERRGEERRGEERRGEERKGN